ncbi:MAG: autotransporter domain-containing protein, partial [Planctomycetia bacterium]|jgi:outer membrane autotransporter protein
MTGGTLLLVGNETIGSLAGTGGTVDLSMAALTLTQDTNTTYAGTFDGAGGTLTKQGTGQLTLTGDSNTWTNSNVTIDGGTLRAEHANALGASMNTLTFGATGGTLSIGADLVVDPASVVLTGNGSILIDNANAWTISGVISGAGNLTLGSAGNGSIQLGGANTYTGATTLAGGNIILESDTAFGATSGVTVASSTTLTNSTAARAIDRNFALSSGATMTIADQGPGSTFSGIISGAGNLALTGSGNVTLSGVNTYTGSTTITGGRAIVTADNNLGSGGALVLNGGNLEVDAANYSTARTITAGAANGGIYKAAAQANTIFTTTGQVNGSGTLTLDLGSLGNIGEFRVQQENIGSDVGFSVQQYTTLVLNGTGSFTIDGLSGLGNVTANTLTAAENLTVNVDTATTFDGNLTMTGNLVKTGAARWTTTGALNVAESTIVSAGELKMNGILNGDSLIVQNGAIFSGTGALNVTNVIVQPGGSILAGNSPGTLNYGGNVTFDGSSIDVSVIPQSASPAPGAYPDPGVDNSLHNVAGTATLNNATVNITADPGTYTDGENYQFLTAGTLAVNGSITTIDNIPGFRASTYTVGNSLWFTLNEIQFLNYANTPNQIAMARYMTNVAERPLSTAMDLLYNTMEARATATDFDQISGAVYGTTSVLGLQNTSNTMNVLAQRLRPTMLGSQMMMAPASYGYSDSPQLVARGQYGCGCEYVPTWGAWSSGFGLGGSVSSDGNAVQRGLEYSLGGTLVGMERRLGDAMRLGFFYSYGQSYINQDVVVGVPNTVNTKNNLWGSYFMMNDGSAYTTLTGAIGYDDYEARRSIQMGAISANANGNHHGWQSAVYVEHGVSMGGPRLLIQPYGALQYIYLRQGTFTESGAGDYGLAVGGIDLHSLRTIAGGRLASTLCFGKSQVTFEGRGLWMHELLDQATGIVDAQLIGNPTGVPAFAISGANLGRDWAVVGTGVNWQLGPRMSVFAAYDAQINARQTFHIGSAGVQMVW